MASRSSTPRPAAWWKTPAPPDATRTPRLQVTAGGLIPSPPPPYYDLGNTAQAQESSVTLSKVKHEDSGHPGMGELSHQADSPIS